MLITIVNICVSLAFDYKNKRELELIILNTLKFINKFNITLDIFQKAFSKSVIEIYFAWHILLRRDKYFFAQFMHRC